MKRLRIGREYWYVDSDLSVRAYYEAHDDIDDKHFNSGNYFHSEEEAEEFAEKIRVIFLERTR